MTLAGHIAALRAACLSFCGLLKLQEASCGHVPVREIGERGDSKKDQMHVCCCCCLFVCLFV